MCTLYGLLVCNQMFLLATICLGIKGCDQCDIEACLTCCTVFHSTIFALNDDMEILFDYLCKEFDLYLTEVAGEGAPDLAPQKFLLPQQFRYLMRCKKYLEKIFLSCLISEIQLFVYIFGQNSKWPPEVRKGSPVKFFEVSYYQNCF